MVRKEDTSNTIKDSFWFLLIDLPLFLLMGIVPATLTILRIMKGVKADSFLFSLFKAYPLLILLLFLPIVSFALFSTIIIHEFAHYTSKGIKFNKEFIFNLSAFFGIVTPIIYLFFFISSFESFIFMNLELLPDHSIPEGAAGLDLQTPVIAMRYAIITYFIGMFIAGFKLSFFPEDVAKSTNQATPQAFHDTNAYESLEVAILQPAPSDIIRVAEKLSIQNKETSLSECLTDNEKKRG